MTSDELVKAAFNVANLASKDPKSLKEAKGTAEWLEWQKAINIEMDQLNQRKTWMLVDPPKEHNIIKNKWVFQRKYDKEGVKIMVLTTQSTVIGSGVIGFITPRLVY